MSRRAPNPSRPVHPCYVSVWEGNAGSEYSTWAKITSRETPDLVTAQGSTLTIYSLCQETGKLLLVDTFPNLYGNVCFLETLENPDPQGEGSDALLLGFSGHPRLAVVAIKTACPKLLLGTTLFDLTPALQDHSYGSISPLEQDLEATVLQKPANTATVSVTLGGGVALACLQLRHTTASGWQATDDKPYLLPLQNLSSVLNENAGSNPASSTNKDLVQSIVTGFGDILSTAFLPGYLEPTLVILHSNPHSGGRAWSGRLGRQGGGTRHAMVLTAVTVTVSHNRSAILWGAQVPAGALQVYPTGDGCMVHCVNSILAVSNVGQIQQCLAVNGLAKSTMTSDYTVQANPWPFPRLAIALDGAKISFVTEKAAFCVLRYGQVFLLQYTDSWSLLPLYKNIGAIGQIANLSCWPLGKMLPKKMLESKFLADSQKLKANLLETGLIFAGSRLGDSSLLGYALETTSVADAIQEDILKDLKEAVNSGELQTGKVADSEYDRILRAEEDALYATSTDNIGEEPAIIPPSDDDEDGSNNAVTSQTRKRARLSQLVVARAFSVLDSVTALGPLGPGCTGPLSKAIIPDKEEAVFSANTAPLFGAPGYIFPCGFGSSGGLALLTAPGRDDRSIIAEEDCVNAKAIFNLPSRGLVVLSTVTGIIFLRLANDRESSRKTKAEGSGEEDRMNSLEEIDMDEWCSEETRKFVLAENVVLLAVCEVDDRDFAMLVGIPVDEGVLTYAFLILSDTTGKLAVKTKNMLPIPEGILINAATPIQSERSSQSLMFACVLSSGDARLYSLDANETLQEKNFEADEPMEVENMDENEEEVFYSNGRIVAVDIFEAPRTFFVSALSNAQSSGDNSMEEETSDFPHKISCEDDQELYGASTSIPGDKDEKPADIGDDSSKAENVALLAICRQSGILEVYATADMALGQENRPIWTAFGTSHGVPQLQTIGRDDPSYRAPRSHKVFANEIRFFFCGPSSNDNVEAIGGPRNFCVAIETSDGDTLLYSADTSNRSKALQTFSRVPMKNVSRPSQEQSKHLSKLRRKGIMGAKDANESDYGFRHSRLFPFRNLSGQDGLFAAVARPIWLVAERGKPTVLCHRSRHAAPSGASFRPVVGFCSGLLKTRDKEESGFMTIHERVGRVGSQRITAFNSLLNLTSAHGLMPGGGLFVQKIPLGVTVRRIQFIDDHDASPGSSPLYAVLVSREIETDLSDLNDDGLTPEERQRILEDRENEKIKRQVEADLGGFDIEQEWVEEIERENCFKIDTSLGGAPPIKKAAYSLWIVDASSGWVVVDSHELEEYEHAMSMEVMHLSEFPEEPGTSKDETISEEDLESRLFITIGTATVDHNGEDVSSKGRVLLFEVNRTKNSTDLNFVYEKKIFHGPVSSLTCLDSEGKKRLVIGAGADVNVEQWGADKLTQVGFFRATMYVLAIKLFKSFFVLSDAYDSLYFLVWRESDKSLTLLAKDYDPIPVYSAGLLSRGGSLDIVCHDDRQNLQFFQYAPGDAAARGGNRLVCRADFHLGSVTTELQSFFCRSSLLVNSATPSSSLAALKQQDKFYGRSDDDQRLGVHFGTSDGGYGAVVPLSEPVYWRLTALQSVMVNALESDCSLSHRAWRLYRRTARGGGCRSNDRKKGVIDGDLVMQYADLSVADQEDLASAIGSTVELVLDNLLELKCSIMVI